MPGKIRFSRKYAKFQDGIRDFEKSFGVGISVTEFMHYDGEPYYPVSFLIESYISTTWLENSEPKTTDTLDVIFKIRSPEHDAPSDYFFFEIVIRNGDSAYYAGFADGSSLSVSDEVINGHHVIETTFDGNVFRWEFQPGVGNGLGQYRASGIIEGSSEQSGFKRGKNKDRSK